MKISMTILSTLFAVALSSSSSSSSSSDDKAFDATALEHLKPLFADWMESFEKVYKDEKEFMKRMMIWAENHFFIEEHNSQKPTPSYELGHNQFSDMTNEEYQQMNKLGMHSPGIVVPMDRTPRPEVERSLKKLPESVDWIQKGGVVPIKNQGQCGSCWAFSAIGAIEGAHFVETGELISLSENELIDCDKLDLGCEGGLMDNAFLFDENSTGICSEEDYPYIGRKHWIRGCLSKRGLCDPVPGTIVKTFYDVKNSTQALKAAIAQQPVSVGIEADTSSFQFYKSGVYDDEACGNQLDHGVVAVGYGTEDGKGYFLVRNSWGESWGDAGYIKMASQTPAVNGTCGILGFASRPILKKE